MKMTKISLRMALLTALFSVMPVMLSACNNGKSGTSEKVKTTKQNGAENIRTSDGDGKIVHLTAALMKANVYDYESSPKEFVYKGDIPAIIDFYATWCPPCRKLSPVLDEIAKEYNGKVIVYKIDIDEERALAEHFGVQSVPTMLFVPIKGIPIRSLGALSKEQVIEQMRQVGVN